MMASQGTVFFDWNNKSEGSYSYDGISKDGFFFIGNTSEGNVSKGSILSERKEYCSLLLYISCIIYFFYIRIN